MPLLPFPQGTQTKSEFLGNPQGTFYTHKVMGITWSTWNFCGKVACLMELLSGHRQDGSEDKDNSLNLIPGIHERKREQNP